MGYTMRTERWPYTEWISQQTGDVTARELYDHAHSDVANANLVDLPEQASTVRELSAILDKGRGWRKVREQV